MSRSVWVLATCLGFALACSGFTSGLPIPTDEAAVDVPTDGQPADAGEEGEEGEEEDAEPEPDDEPWTVPTAEPQAWDKHPLMELKVGLMTPAGWEAAVDGAGVKVTTPSGYAWKAEPSDVCGVKIDEFKASGEGMLLPVDEPGTVVYDATLEDGTHYCGVLAEHDVDGAKWCLLAHRTEDAMMAKDECLMSVAVLRTMRAPQEWGKAKAGKGKAR